jgi:hypothetical protein
MDQPSPDTTPETNPDNTRRQIQKELRGHSEFIQFLLEKWPGSPDEDELLRLKQDIAQASVCLRRH